MASVNEIINRLEREHPGYGVFRPAPPSPERNAMNWLPNRKVFSGFVAGFVTWLALQLTGVELDQSVAEAVAFLVTTVVAYLVPLPKAEDEAAD